ncbi:MAG: hypothetical protein QXF40_05435 [Metallosphaera sp.]|uniref:hypothetical protein n=1 Tax=Metallosphaera sp. TaxID=2020860 RepID=UPI0031635910
MIRLNHQIIREIKDLTCILGEWDDYKETMARAIKDGELIVQYIDPFSGEYMSKRDGRRSTYFIPKSLVRGRITSRELLSGWFKSEVRVNEIMFLLNVPDRPLDQLSDLNLAKVYLSPLFRENVKFAIAEDFLQEIEEQSRLKVLKLMVKIIRSRGLDSLLFLGYADLVNPCESVYVMYEDEVVEIGKTFLHPYSKTILNSAIKVGKLWDKVKVTEVGKGSLSGCRFHDYCEIMKSEKTLQRKCRLEKPPMLAIERGEVRCWNFFPGINE